MTTSRTVSAYYLHTLFMSSPRVSARSTDQHNTTERPLPAATSISTHACTAFCRSECLLQTTGSKLKHKDLLATLYAHLSKQAKIWQLRKLRALAVHQCQIVVKNQFFFLCVWTATKDIVLVIAKATLRKNAREEGRLEVPSVCTMYPVRLHF